MGKHPGADGVLTGLLICGISTFKLSYKEHKMRYI